MLELISSPWPWYVAGPIIGLLVPALLIYRGKQFGLSANLRHVCAATLPGSVKFFQYDWKKSGSWNLVFILGIAVGGFLTMQFLTPADYSVALSPATVSVMEGWGITEFGGLVPAELISWSALGTFPGLLMILGGGFLIGFGSRYAGGCTSGHAISGLSDFQFPSLVAVIGFFAGGMLVTYFLLPLIL